MTKVAATGWCTSLLIYSAIGSLLLGLGFIFFVAHAYRISKVDILRSQSLEPVLDRAGLPDAPITVYLVGDSQIAHWPLDCRKSWSLYRSGFPGQSTGNIVSATNGLFGIVKPNVVFVVAGGNDLSAASLLPEKLQKQAIADSISSYRRILALSIDAGAQKIFISRVEKSRFGVIFSFLLGSKNFNKLRDQLNSGLVDICQKQCQVVSLREMIGVSSNAEWKSYLADSAHFNDKAYGRLAESLNDMIGM